MKYASLGDDALINLIAHNQDAAALRALYDRYNRLVFSVIFGLLSDERRTEETTLDVFTQVWENAHTYDSNRAKVKTWIVSMARNRAIDVLRRLNSRPEANSVAFADVAYQLETNSPLPEQAVEKSLQSERVHRALADLPEEQLQVIKLAYFGGYTQRQIADELDLPLGTVKTRIRLAMKKLQRFIIRERADPESGI